MPVSLEAFCRQVSELGLLSDSELSSAQATVSSLSASEATRAFAKNLVRSNKVTVFQAQQLYNGSGSTLALGNYLILDKIGQGGMGMVYKAIHRRMDRIVVVKVLPRELVKTSSSIQRFQREVRAVAKLDHPNVVASYDADESAGTHFLVMQFVDGKDLAAKVREQGRLPIAKAINYIEQAAKGLAYAHGLGIIHRDIKPANLLLGRDEIVRVLDLGLARILGDSPNLDDQLTHSGHIMGTVDYMAPEQALDTRSADARADIYSLGATFWYLVTAEPLYPGESMVKKLVAHQHAPLRVLSEIRSDAASEMDDWLQRMIAKAPDDRFQSMTEVMQSIDALRRQTNLDRDDDIPSSSRDIDRDFQANSSGVFKVNQPLASPTATSSESIRIKTSPRIARDFRSGQSDKPVGAANKLLANRSWSIAAGSLLLLMIAATFLITRGSNTANTTAELPAKIDVINPPSTSQPSPEKSVDPPWEDLFDGRSTTGWSTLGPFRVQNSLLVANGGRSNAVSKDQYTDFELEAVWKIGAGANGGIMYRDEANQGIVAGNEYQIADHHSDPAIYPPERQTASLYGLLAPTQDAMHPFGEWNTTRIICSGTKIEHWLNQRKVLEYDTASDSFRDAKLKSTFTGKDLIGSHPNNHLLLQSINGETSYRSIRVRRLVATGVDLLAGLDVSKLKTEAFSWQFNGDILVGNGIAQSFTKGWLGLQFSQEASGDYDLELSFKTDRIFPLQVDLPLGHEQAIRIDLSPNGSGLLMIDGVDYGVNREAVSTYSNNDAKLTSQKWQLLSGKVRHQSDNVDIEVALDGILVGKFTGARSRITLPKWVKPDPGRVKLQGLCDLSNVELQIRQATVMKVPTGDSPATL